MVVEDIGGGNVLKATLKSCYKLGEEDIPNAYFNTSFGSYIWKDAKKITYLDGAGRTDYIIVWKCPAADYPEFSGDGILYISDYLTGDVGRCFMLYNPDNQMVYGIVADSDNITCSESKLMYDILGLNKSEYSLLNVEPPKNYSTGSYSSSSGGSSHYHTVVPDRYTLSRTDPGAYYDHYEYGDNYEIDDYLESEGYD